jgi:hypothetical protein
MLGFLAHHPRGVWRGWHLVKNVLAGVHMMSPCASDRLPNQDDVYIDFRGERCCYVVGWTWRALTPSASACQETWSVGQPVAVQAQTDV